MTLKVLTTTILELGESISCEVIYDNKTKYKLDLSLKDFLFLSIT